MSEMRFDGQVAIVTGAGSNPGLGRVYAMALAARGAKVVVNDFGLGPDGKGRRPSSAHLVVEEIIDAGGEAVEDTHDVAEEDSARAVVRTAIDTWGQVDVLVNNAGVTIIAGFDETTSDDVRRVIDSHLYGNIWMCRAVWPYMRDAGYGRIINISSGALHGLGHAAVYGAAKGGILALSRSIAVEGAEHGIKANAVGPEGETGALDLLLFRDKWLSPPPELMAPLVTLLAHQDCPISGRYFLASNEHTTVRSYFDSRGYNSRAVSAEDVLAQIDDITDTSEPVLVPDPLETTPPPDVVIRKPYVP